MYRINFVMTKKKRGRITFDFKIIIELSLKTIVNDVNENFK